MNKIIIFGSARSFGNTRKTVNEILNNTIIDLVGLNNLNISPAYSFGITLSSSPISSSFYLDLCTL
ncbi:MAG: hypothetical protein LCH20_00905 [Proteobacteria bacterium]|nr:hypothetical protein [Pseudomonadota bacterium]